MEEDVNGEFWIEFLESRAAAKRGIKEGDRRVSCSVRASDKRIRNAFISPFYRLIGRKKEEEVAVELAS